MANDLTKVTGTPIAILGDALNIISNTILESRREEAKTERLEIEARAYMCERVEETKRELARLQNEDNRDRRIHEERLEELKNQFFRDLCEYNLQILDLAYKNREREINYAILERQLEEINQTEREFKEMLKKNTGDRLVLEYLKNIMDNKQRILSGLVRGR